MSRVYPLRVVACAAAAFVLPACTEIDPLTREGVWRPLGVNETNLRAMVAVPSDLVAGRAARSSDGNQAAKAMDRLRFDRVYPLPNAGISKVGAGAGAAAPAAAAPSSGPL